MLRGITALLGLQLVGEVVARGLQLPVPGPVIGMLLLLALLLRRGETPTWLEAPSRGLLSHLGLLFVPAGVGIIAHAGLLAQSWLPILLTLLLGTAATLAVTALTLRLALALGARRAAPVTEARHD
jgi:holin-like protein